MDKILLLTDFSSHAEKAYSVAAKIAKENNAQLCFYHIIISEVSTDSVAYKGITQIQQLQQNDETAFWDGKKKLERLKKNPVFEGLVLDSAVELNFVSDSVENMVNELNEKDFDLIVMGTSGKEDKSTSFAEVVTRSSKSPVVTCYKSVKEFEIKKTLIATDLKTVNAGFFKRLEEVVGGSTGVKTLLFVNTKKNFMTTSETEHHYRELVNKYHLKNTELVIRNADNVTEGVFKETEKSGYDLLAVTTHGRKGIARLFNKSQAEELVNTSELPVFSYNLHDFLGNSGEFVTRNIV